MSEYRRLVRDTIHFLKQEGHLDKKASLPLPEKKKIQLSPPKPKPSPTIEQPKEKVEMPLPKEDTSIFEKIQKHLPHIRLIKKIPEMNQVAIVYTNEEDLPFLNNIAKAIQERFCPVQIVSGAPSFPCCLVIAQRKLETIPTNRQIVLEPIATYVENAEQKKQLWRVICHHLSQPSS